MTAVAADFIHILIAHIFTVVAAILFVFFNRAAAHLAGAFISVFHIKKSSVDFELLICGNKSMLHQSLNLGNDLQRASLCNALREKFDFVRKLN